MCTLAEDANKPKPNELAGGVPYDSSEEDHDEHNASSRPRGAKILAHGCCPGLASKSRLYTF